jgi:adenylate kinase family enzyme
VKQRLDVNRESTEALATFYGSASKLARIDGTGEPSQVTDCLFEALADVPSGSRKA